MSDFKNKVLEMSGEISRENEIIEYEGLNEDHKLVARNADLEARLHESFAKLMRELRTYEYSLGGYSALPYGKVNPAEVIEQAKNNQYMYKKLRSIAYEKMSEVKEIVDAVFAPEEYEEKEARDEVLDNDEIDLEPSVSTGTQGTVKDALGSSDAYLSKKTKMKKNRY